MKKIYIQLFTIFLECDVITAENNNHEIISRGELLSKHVTRMLVLIIEYNYKS